MQTLGNRAESDKCTSRKDQLSTRQHVQMPSKATQGMTVARATTTVERERERELGQVCNNQCIFLASQASHYFNTACLESLCVSTCEPSNTLIADNHRQFCLLNDHANMPLEQQPSRTSKTTPSVWGPLFQKETLASDRFEPLHIRLEPLHHPESSIYAMRESTLMPYSSIHAMQHLVCCNT